MRPRSSLHSILCLLALAVGACEAPSGPPEAKAPASRAPALSSGVSSSTGVPVSVLGSLNDDGDPISYATGINRHGDIVGFSGTFGTPFEAFLWTPDEGMIGLGTFGGNFSRAEAINAAGTVVGSATDATGSGRPFRWTRDEGLVDLSSTLAPGASIADINDDGNLVGLHGRQGFFWSETTGLVRIGTLGGSFSTATALNNHDEVTGYSWTAGGETHAFVWSLDDGMRDLGTLPGGGSSQAEDINDRGVVAGWSSSGDGVEHAVIWSASGAIEDLGTLVGFDTHAMAINDRGNVVGWGVLDADRLGVHPFVWSRGQGMRDLGTLAPAWRDHFADAWPEDLNDRGQAAGVSSGSPSSGWIQRALMWNVNQRPGGGR